MFDTYVHMHNSFNYISATFVTSSSLAALPGWPEVRDWFCSPYVAKPLSTVTQWDLKNVSN